ATFLRRPYREAIAGVNPAPGLSFALFDGKFTTVQDLESGSPVSTGISRSLDLEQFGRTMKYGVRFEGYVNVEADSFYRFVIESDDGSVLRIDDEVVVDNDGNHGPRVVTGHIPLRRGLHKISLRYYQSEGGATLAVSWAPAGGELQPLAGPTLFH
ncbi:MAG: PA14 domain-containing protein, partial [Steroidobacterales bacterium]